MNDANDIKQYLAEIAHVLSMSTDALLALSAHGEARQTSFESEASEIAANFRIIVDSEARQMLLRLSRTLAGKPSFP